MGDAAQQTARTEIKATLEELSEAYALTVAQQRDLHRAVLAEALKYMTARTIAELRGRLDPSPDEQAQRAMPDYMDVQGSEFDHLLPDTEPDLRSDGIVPDDDIVSRCELTDTLEVVEDGNGTLHIARTHETQPRQRLAAVSPTQRDALAEFIAITND